MSLSTEGMACERLTLLAPLLSPSKLVPGRGPRWAPNLHPPPGGAAPGGASHELSEHAVAGQSQERRAVEIERHF